MSHFARSGFVLCILVSACSSSDPSTPASDVVTFSMLAQLEAGKEVHLCQYVQMPSSADGEIWLSGRSHEYNAGSHHYGLYRTTVDALPDGFDFNQPQDCWGPSDPMKYTTDFIVLEQTARADVDFPEGVGLRFKSGEILMVQLHALNPQAVAADATLNLMLKTISKSRVTNEMALLQFYDPFIYVPPQSDAKAGLRCRIPDGLTLMEGNGHFHLKGVDFQAFLDPKEGDRATASFLESTDWEHPQQYQGSMSISAGSHIRLQCAYHNTDARPYIQGQDKFENEMCMFWGYAYPAPADRAAINCAGPYGDEFGVGTKTCAETTACLQLCPPGEAPSFGVPGRVDVGPCFQKCMVDSCPSAGALIMRQDQCIQAQCQAECAAGDCTSCAIAKCADEVTACQTTACN
jgi:hypothetical protein